MMKQSNNQEELKQVDIEMSMKSFRDNLFIVKKRFFHW
jgi:hypothetical protein